MPTTHIQTSLNGLVDTNPPPASSGDGYIHLSVSADTGIPAINQAIIERAHARVSAFFDLSDLLTEMQHELACREWDGDVYARVDRAADFRGALFDAIMAYIEGSR